MSMRRELNKRRQARRAARATEQGVAGHQAAMEALGRAAGWTRLPEVNTGPYETVSHAGNIKTRETFSPGAVKINGMEQDSGVSRKHGTSYRE